MTTLRGWRQRWYDYKSPIIITAYENVDYESVKFAFNYVDIIIHD